MNDSYMKRRKNMDTNFGPFFRKIRMDKNISISSLADEHISKGMISKFERNDSEISVSRFFHLLEKVRVRPIEFELAKNYYHPSGFEALLHQVQKCVLEGNQTKLKKLADFEFDEWQQTNDMYSRLNYVMLTALLNIYSPVELDQNHLDFLSNYLFKCENWGYYETVLYSNSMSILPIETTLVFSKSIPQKTLLLKDSGRLFEISINVLVNTLILCIEHNREAEGLFFIKIIDGLGMAETLIFERMLFNVYKGVFFTKFNVNKLEGEKLTQNALLILQLAGCESLYEMLLEDSNKMLV